MKGYIYKIINKINGNFYIGSTLSPNKRKQEHFNKLRNGTHHSFHLQKAYNLYGDENFEFLIVKMMEIENEDEIRELEKRYINFCWSSGKLYNVSKNACGGDLLSYHPFLDEIKEKQRKNSTERWKNKSEEEKKIYSEKLKGKGNPNFGNKWSFDQRQKASKQKKDYYKKNSNPIKGKTFEEVYGKEKAKEIKMKLSELASERTGDKNPFYGKHHTEQTRNKLSEKRKGNIPSDAKKVLYNGKIYISAMDCSKKTGINYLTICYRCRKQIYGFSYLQDEKQQNLSKTMWSKEKCFEIAKHCKTKKEFEEKQPSAYQWVIRNGYMEEFSKKYFIEIRHKWTLDEIISIAKKYDSYSEFWNNEKKAVNVMYCHKWTDLIKNCF